MSLNKLLTMSLVVCLVALAGATGMRAQDPDQVAGKHVKFTRISSASTKKGAAQTLPGITGIDSVPNFSGTYSTPGFDPNGNPQSTWFYNTLGNSPATSGTTTLGGPIVPVSVDMRFERTSFQLITKMSNTETSISATVATSERLSSCIVSRAGST